MLKYIQTVIVILCFVSQNLSQVKQYFDVNWNKTNENLAIYYSETYSKPNKANLYQQIDFYVNGNAQMIALFSDKSLRVKEGKWEYFYDNGSMSSEKRYRNNLLQGKYTAWYRNGKIETTGEYVDGKKVGKWTSFFTSGELMTETYYLENSDISAFQSFYKTGEVREKGSLKEDKRHGAWQKYWPNGKLNYTGKYLENYRDGEWNFYYSSGIKSATVIFSQGQIIQQTYYNISGDLQSKEGTSLKPYFIGGREALNQFIKDNLNIPSWVKDKNVKGQVFVSFYVESNGSLSQIKIEKSLHSELDEAVIKLIENMPNWSPGKLYNRVEAIQDILVINVN